MRRRRIRMMRTLCMVSLFMIIGAIINIAVAWGCAYKLDPFAGEMRNVLSKRSGRMIDLFRADSFGSTMLFVINSLNDESKNATGEYSLLVPYYASTLITPPDQFGREGLLLERRWLNARGWPMRTTAAEGFMRLSYPGQKPIEKGWENGVVNGIEIENRSWQLGHHFTIPKVIPTRVIWTGFVINTLFYAALLWLLLLGPFALRRWARKHRGLCPKCAYPIGISDTCTECGSPLSAKLRTKTQKALTL